MPLTILISRILATGQNEFRLAAALVNAEQAEAEADGAIQEAVFHLAAGQWPITGGTYGLPLPDGKAFIRIEPDGDKINPNTASSLLLQFLMEETGTGRRSAASLAEAIVQWRTPLALLPFGVSDGSAGYRAASQEEAPAGHGFRNLDTLSSVNGMTPAILDRLRPHLSLYQPGMPDAATGDIIVARAMRRAADAEGMRIPPPAGPPDIHGGSRIAVTIIACVQRGEGRMGATARSVTVQLNPDRAVALMLDWQALPPGRAMDRIRNGR